MVLIYWNSYNSTIKSPQFRTIKCKRKVVGSYRFSGSGAGAKGIKGPTNLSSKSNGINGFAFEYGSLQDDSLLLFKASMRATSPLTPLSSKNYSSAVDAPIACSSVVRPCKALLMPSIRSVIISQDLIASRLISSPEARLITRLRTDSFGTRNS